MVHPEHGEFAARYGGEEFVCILAADSQQEAYTRVDDARKKIASLKWENHKPARVTVSGGIISCMKYDQLTVFGKNFREEPDHPVKKRYLLFICSRVRGSTQISGFSQPFSVSMC